MPLVILVMWTGMSFAQIRDRYELYEGIHWGGYPACAAVSEDYAFLCQGLMLYTLDIRGDKLDKVNALQLPAEPSEMVIAGTYAYLYPMGTDSAFRVLDISDPLHPVLMGAADVKRAWSTRLHACDRYACLTMGGKLVVIDTSDPMAPQVTATLDVDAKDVYTTATAAFVATGDGLAIYDMTDLTDPTLISTTDLAGALCVASEGSFAYVGQVSQNDMKFGVQIIDVSNLNNPLKNGFIETKIIEGSTTFLKNPQRLVVQQDMLTIDCQESGILLFFADVSNPDSPDLKGHLRFDEGQFPSTQSLAMSLPYLYVATGATAKGLIKINISDPANPVIEQMIQEPWDVLHVYSDEQRLYAASAERLWIYEFPEPTRPVLLGSDPAWGGLIHIYVQGQYTYGVRQDTLYILNTSDPGNMFRVGDYPSTMAGELRRVMVREGYAYLLNNDRNNPALEIIDVTDPNNPVLTVTYTLPAEGRALYVDGSLSAAIVAYGGEGTDHGMLMIDIQDPANPVLLSTTPVRARPSCVWVSDTLAYIGSNDTDQDSCYLEQINIKDPEKPRVLNHVSRPGIIADVKVAGNYVIASLPTGSLYLSNSSFCNMGYMPVPSSIFVCVLWYTNPYRAIFVAISGFYCPDMLQASASWGIFNPFLWYWLKPKKIEITPTDSTVAKNDSVQFTYRATDRNGNETNASVTWSATGGEIDTLTGKYLATESGTHTITCTDSSSMVSAHVTLVVTESTSVEQNRPVVSYSLQQNYPNPFNPVTTIEYAVQHAEIVDLELYDITGRSVRKLIHRHHKPGIYQVTLHAKNLPSGIYFYRIRMGEFSAVKKMVLIE